MVSKASAIAYELAMIRCPEYMESQGFKDRLSEGVNIDFRAVRENSSSSPIQSLHDSVLQNLPQPNKSTILLEAIRHTDLWPWNRKKKMSKSDQDFLDGITYDMADRSIIQYYFNHTPFIKDTDIDMNASNTCFVVVSHDQEMINTIRNIRTGQFDNVGLLDFIYGFDSEIESPAHPNADMQDLFDSKNRNIDEIYQKYGIPEQDHSDCSHITAFGLHGLIDMLNKEIEFAKKYCIEMNDEQNSAVDNLKGAIEKLKNLKKQNERQPQHFSCSHGVPNTIRINGSSKDELSATK